MRRGNPSLTLALCASLTLHAVALTFFIDRFVRESARIWLPGTRATVVAVTTREQDERSPVFGMADGAGQGVNEAPGDEPMVGTGSTQAQAFLSRDPVGAGRVGDDPSMSVLPKADLIQQPPAPTETAAAPQRLGIASAAAEFALPRARPSQPPAPAAPPARAAPSVPPVPPAPRGEDETSLVRRKDAPVPTRDLTPDAADGIRAPAAPVAAADPAIMSDSESDPFSADPSVEFRDGRVVARFGRKVKTIRPRLSLADEYDLMSMQFPRLIVRVQVDTQGAVSKVDVVKSTGSDSVDQAVKVALYQWWFEPRKDDAGRAAAQTVEFPIAWR